MNIKDLKILVANLPEDIDEQEFEMLCADIDELKTAQRAHDLAKLEELRAKVAALQAKLNVAPPPVRPPPSAPIASTYAQTDYGQNVLDDTEDAQPQTASSFVAELAALRAHNVEKRARRRLS